MSFLATESFDDANTVISQTQRILSSIIIQTIRVKMLKHGTIADGTLTLDVLDGATVIGTSSITAAQFEAVNATFAHGYFSFEFTEHIKINLNKNTANQELTYRFTMSGHTEDTDNYIALVRQFESPFVDEFGTRPSSTTPEEDGWFNPYGIEIYGIQS